MTMIRMEQTWRWFGPHDPVSLQDARQAGATGIVTALHHIPTGEVWPTAEIEAKKQQIEATGLTWSVAESIPVHEAIKTRTGAYEQYIRQYQQSLRNLGASGVKTVCYNFMPCLDATRTSFQHRMPDGAVALLFDAVALAAFDLYLLQRPEARTAYTGAQQEAAAAYLSTLDEQEIAALTATVIAGFPGVGADYTLEQFRSALQVYRCVDAAALKEHLALFLREIMPVAEEAGIRMAIHPDDPPFPLLGLPRIVSTEKDLQEILSFYPGEAHGLCLCTGSLGVRADNDLAGMVGRLGSRIHFVHLRSTRRLLNGSFYEDAHLNGDVDMYAVMKALLQEQQRRKASGRTDFRLPMRPDHGHQMLDDLQKKTIPGYSAIGRLRGLAELRGLEEGILRAYNE